MITIQAMYSSLVPPSLVPLLCDVSAHMMGAFLLPPAQMGAGRIRPRQKVCVSGGCFVFALGQRICGRIFDALIGGPLVGPCLRFV